MKANSGANNFLLKKNGEGYYILKAYTSLRKVENIFLLSYSTLTLQDWSTYLYPWWWKLRVWEPVLCPRSPHKSLVLNLCPSKANAKYFSTTCPGSGSRVSEPVVTLDCHPCTQEALLLTTCDVQEQLCLPITHISCLSDSQQTYGGWLAGAKDGYCGHKTQPSSLATAGGELLTLAS